VAITPSLRAEPPAGGPDAKPKPGWGEGRERGPRLTPEEQQKLKTVREQVLKANPDLAKEVDALKERGKAAQDKLHTLMIAANPAVKPIIDKIEAARGKDGERGTRPDLTEDERKTLGETRKTVLDANADLNTELQAVAEARRPLEKKVADAMIAADPSVKDLLAKVRPPGGPGGRRPHGPDGDKTPGA
jgi:hypothetical protein